MKIEKATELMRKGKVCRCKRRYYSIIDNCLFRLYRRDPDEKYVRIYGVANLNGQDFATDEWEEIRTLVLVTDGSEFY